MSERKFQTENKNKEATTKKTAIEDKSQNTNRFLSFGKKLTEEQDQCHGTKEKSFPFYKVEADLNMDDLPYLTKSNNEFKALSKILSVKELKEFRVNLRKFNNLIKVDEADIVKIKKSLKSFKKEVIIDSFMLYVMCNEQIKSIEKIKHQSENSSSINYNCNNTNNPHTIESNGNNPHNLYTLNPTTMFQIPQTNYFLPMQLNNPSGVFLPNAIGLTTTATLYPIQLQQGLPPQSGLSTQINQGEESSKVHIKVDANTGDNAWSNNKHNCFVEIKSRSEDNFIQKKRKPDQVIDITSDNPELDSNKFRKICENIKSLFTNKEYGIETKILLRGFLDEQTVIDIDNFLHQNNKERPEMLWITSTQKESLFLKRNFETGKITVLTIKNKYS